MNNPWVLSAVECHQGEEQFLLLQPVNGHINGDQVRPFLLKSGLPPNVLAQVNFIIFIFKFTLLLKIWQLADLNKDGKLDRLEFFIAMRLVRNCLNGIALPPSLPESMKQLPMNNLVNLFSMQQQQHQQQFMPAMSQMLTNQLSTYGSTLPANFGSANNQLYSSSNASFSGKNF